MLVKTLLLSKIYKENGRVEISPELLVQGLATLYPSYDDQAVRDLILSADFAERTATVCETCLDEIIADSNVFSASVQETANNSENGHGINGNDDNNNNELGGSRSSAILNFGNGNGADRRSPKASSPKAASPKNQTNKKLSHSSSLPLIPSPTKTRSRSANALQRRPQLVKPNKFHTSKGRWAHPGPAQQRKPVSTTARPMRNVEKKKTKKSPKPVPDKMKGEINGLELSRTRQHELDMLIRERKSLDQIHFSRARQRELDSLIAERKAFTSAPPEPTEDAKVIENNTQAPSMGTDLELVQYLQSVIATNEQLEKVTK